MANIPFLVDATVVQQDPDGYRLYVSIDHFGGQVPFLPVDVLTHGPRDAQRGNWPALPAIGTRGIVAFTRGDDRTGRWIGATAPALPASGLRWRAARPPPAPRSPLHSFCTCQLFPRIGQPLERSSGIPRTLR